MGTTASWNAMVQSEVESLSGRLHVITGSFTFSSDYATGGEDFSISAWTDVADSMQILLILFEPTGGYIFEYLRETGKVRALDPANEPSEHANLSGIGPIPFIALVH
jgi:hypothetical protein